MTILFRPQGAFGWFSYTTSRDTIQQYQQACSVEAYFNNVLSTVGASKDATFYKLFRSLPHPVICLQVDSQSQVLSGQRSSSAPSIPVRSTVVAQNFFAANSRYEEFEIDGLRFISWAFVGHEIEEIDPRPWRAIYAEILKDTGMQANLQSISAILASACNKNKNQSEHDICGAVFRAFSNYDRYQTVVRHPLFEQYVVKRVRELKLRG